ncbi:hypothetical protein [Methylobacterium oryzihabitans]|uniref:Uncharacterized protein n=1 Tax=Methylobacterium oryzihabitans TaxID=2499852 RepID=A0A3S2XS93_9HYPH|nr:hypothetical protein [Methylobacterium oryzihabitans]RVU21697.1 hypothetical protein EOE48_01220 [Methylobacterium oryzihabitans]
METRFSEPVVVWLDPEHPEFGLRDIRTVAEGLAALHRYDLGDARSGPCRHLWDEAAAALVRARSEPTPDHLARARAALGRLVGAVAPVPRDTRDRVAPRSWFARMLTA